MKVKSLETFLVNAGLRNYLFLLLHTDNGLTGLGEATLEWQEKTVETIIHEWVEKRVGGEDPFDVERVVGGMIRDQYQGGATVMSAISAVEVAMWDIIGKSCGQPVYRLLGGRSKEHLWAYANGWYGGLTTLSDYAERARDVVAKGFRALKFDPFGTAWKTMTNDEMDEAEAIVEAVRGAVGDKVDIMIEVHGRLSVTKAVDMGLRLERYRVSWYEEPVTPNSLEMLAEVKQRLPFPIAAGERLYTLNDFYRLTQMRAADIVQMDPSHCGGLLASKKIAAMAEAQDIAVSPHCSIGPVGLCAALHFDWATPNVTVQEDFSEFDVPWRDDLVCGWNSLRRGEFALLQGPGLGIELDIDACLARPYVQHAFPSLWDSRWLADFTQSTEIEEE